MPQDDEGLDPDALEARARRRAAAGVPLHDPDLPEPERPHALEERRRRARRARARARPARARGRPLRARPLRGRAAAVAVRARRAASGSIYSSSFSKTIAPGLRVGCFVLPDELARELEARRGVDVHHAGAARRRRRSTSSSRRGALRAEPRARRAACSEARRDAMLEALDRELAGRATLEPARRRLLPLARPAGGVDAAELLERGRGDGVTFVKGARLLPGGAGERASARLAFSFVSPDEIAEGVARLAALAARRAPSASASAAARRSSGRGTSTGCCGGGASAPRLRARNVGQARLAGERAEPGAPEVAVVAGCFGPSCSSSPFRRGSSGTSRTVEILRLRSSGVKRPRARNPTHFPASSKLRRICADSRPRGRVASARNAC